VIENKLDVDLQALVRQAQQGFDSQLTQDDITEQVTRYFFERLRGYAMDKGVKADVFESVLAVQPTRPLDFMQRLNAVTEFRGIEAAESLAASNKRISNILRKNDAEGEGTQVDSKLLNESAEQALADKLVEVTKQVKPLVEKADYAGVLRELAGMRETVDGFFDHVMVMADDEAVRNNRLALLNQTRALFLGVADISYLQE
jgi:glycyl-tRNA synthetase beta chain